ncbi:prepilin-type N-terminal cleavage/methylation domain-containing protein [Candidatus Kaiserbacteria bacterium]|nr:prepilin-type N-terminal cleavage/methylation domain-containing protein [Candidatus Kaiserbacteria bacterium]
MANVTNTKRGFTLIETLVAVSLLTVSIVAPMSLVSQSLAAATYSRDQVTAYSLAQEGIESVRSIRDGNILENALLSAGKSLLDGIPIGTPFTIDARESIAANAIQTCSGTCPQLQTDGTLYGYAPGDRSNPARDVTNTWRNTNFTRTVTAVYAGPSTVNSGQDAIRVSVTVSWRTPNGQTRSFTIYENMYRWVEDGSAAS